MLLRYLAKQSAENYGSSLNSGSSSTSSHFVNDTAVSSASLLWTDGSAATVVDTGSGLASTMSVVSGAMLAPFDSADVSLFGSESLASGLFFDSEKNRGFLG